MWKHCAIRVISEQRVRGMREMEIMSVVLNHSRNSLPNSSGYSPAQWVLGRQPQLDPDITIHPAGLASHQLASVSYTPLTLPTNLPV